MGLAGFWWFILAYLVLEIGEMALSPIGLSAVTTLSVPRGGQFNDGRLVLSISIR
ncbi:MAG: hypothetical protein U5L01_00900 [Rheinheimera sp.]|nr:hypothetical protein [Rheinheimera sp.]